jgi:hypothetical protein
MDTIKAHDHVITDEHIEFLRDAMELLDDPQTRREHVRDRDHLPSPLTMCSAGLRLSPFIQHNQLQTNEETMKRL